MEAAFGRGDWLLRNSFRAATVSPVYRGNMTTLKLLLSVGACLYAGILATAEELSVPTADNLRWISLDFKTILTWTARPSENTYTVLYSADDGDWTESSDCIGVSDMECDLTSVLQHQDRVFMADIQTNTADQGYAYDEDELPHTYSSPFNPFRQSNISAVKFTLHPVDESRVIVNITDTLTAIHQRGQQLTIRDILRSDLKYKITYYKAGSTGKREVTSPSSVAEVPQLDSGTSYCFMVAAFIPSRPKETQQGAWSSQLCTQSQGTTQGLSLGGLVGIIFILIAALIIIIIITVLCCKRCRRRNKSQQTSQTSGPI